MPCSVSCIVPMCISNYLSERKKKKLQKVIGKRLNEIGNLPVTSNGEILNSFCYKL